MTWTLAVPYVATFSALLLLAGFTCRDPMKLRAFAILGSLTFIVYFGLAYGISSWATMVVFVLIIGINITMMWMLIKDHRKFKLSPEELMLFARLPGLTPGQYKLLLDISEWHNPKVPMQLTLLGSMPDALYYVLEGRVEVNRDNNKFLVGPHAFIGELAFLRKKPATATTFALAGGLIVSWEQKALRELLAKHDDLRKAIDHLLSGDLAEKIAKTSAPFLQEQTR
jgi:Cyclic nucleotide-binding domain